MNLNRRRPFRSRQHKNGFRRKNSSTSLQTGKLNYSNGNSNFRRNENISSPAGLEKTISKFEQLAKDDKEVAIMFFIKATFNLQIIIQENLQI